MDYQQWIEKVEADLKEQESNVEQLRQFLITIREQAKSKNTFDEEDVLFLENYISKRSESLKQAKQDLKERSILYDGTVNRLKNILENRSQVLEEKQAILENNPELKDFFGARQKEFHNLWTQSVEWIESERKQYEQRVNNLKQQSVRGIKIPQLDDIIVAEEKSVGQNEVSEVKPTKVTKKKKSQEREDHASKK